MALANLGLLTEDRYDEYIDHVMSLTPKQRKKLHIMVKDENGVGRRMFFSTAVSRLRQLAAL